MRIGGDWKGTVFVGLRPKTWKKRQPWECLCCDTVSMTVWHSFFGPALCVPTCEATKSSFQSHVLPSRVEPNHGTNSARNGELGWSVCCQTEGEVHGGMPESSPKWAERVQHLRVPVWRGQEEGWRSECHRAEVAGHVGGAGIPRWKGRAEMWTGRVFPSECHMAGGWCCQPRRTISRACPWNFHHLPHLPRTSSSRRSNALWPRGVPGLPTLPAAAPMPYVSWTRLFSQQRTFHGLRACCW